MPGGAQKRLNDLRKTREILPFEGEDDGEPFKIEVWVVKLNDADTESCRRAANAAKARLLMDRNDKDSELWQSCYTQTTLLGDTQEPLVDWLSQWHVVDKIQELRAELAGDDKSEWAKDEYLTGLFNLWIGTDDEPGLMAAWTCRDQDPATLDPDIAGKIPEAIRVYDELERFESVLGEKVEAERLRFVREEDATGIEELRRRIIERMLDERANEVWVAAFDRSKIYYCTRELSDWRKRYFADPSLVDDTDDEFKEAILKKYDEISVKHVEGKGSPAPQSSSPQPGSSGEGETSDSSGPMAATG